MRGRGALRRARAAAVEVANGVDHQIHFLIGHLRKDRQGEDACRQATQVMHVHFDGDDHPEYVQIRNNFV